MCEVEVAFEAAKALRLRGIWAKADSWRTSAWIDVPRMTSTGTTYERHLLDNAKFKGLSAIEIADEIKACESVLAQEWAGDI